jgi:hypothetical protein
MVRDCQATIPGSLSGGEISLAPGNMDLGDLSFCCCSLSRADIKQWQYQLGTPYGQARCSGRGCESEELGRAPLK